MGKIRGIKVKHVKVEHDPVSDFIANNGLHTVLIVGLKNDGSELERHRVDKGKLLNLAILIGHIELITHKLMDEVSAADAVFIRKNCIKKKSNPKIKKSIKESKENSDILGKFKLDNDLHVVLIVGLRRDGVFIAYNFCKGDIYNVAKVIGIVKIITQQLTEELSIKEHIVFHRKN
jgi:hypothetical protein